MDPRFITRKMHAFLDYPVALVLMAAPVLLKLGEPGSTERWLSIGVGMAAFGLTLLTDHQLGVLRVLPYGFHLLVDFLVGLTFIAAPFLLGFSALGAWYYWANGVAVLFVVGLHKPEPSESPQSAREPETSAYA